MLSIGIFAVIVLCIGGLVWRRRRHRYVPTMPSSPETIPSQTLAFRAFAHGNACLAEGKFPEAIAAFQQAREIEPKHPHIAGRLAEVERRQQAAGTAPLINPTA